MRVLIVGAGKTGAFLAEKLAGDHEVVAIEQRQQRAEYVRQLVPNADVIDGDACEPDILETAGVEYTDIIAAVTGDDEDNLVVAMLAKMYRVPLVYARVNHPRNEWLFDKKWGVDATVCSPTMLYEFIERGTAEHARTVSEGAPPDPNAPAGGATADA